MSQYELDRLRRMKVNEDFMRSLGIEISASVSERTTAENRRRSRTRAGVVREGTAMVGRTIRTQSAEPRDAEPACLLGKKGRSIQGIGRASTWHSERKRPPLKLEVPGSSPRGWFNGRAGNRVPYSSCWLETARGLSPIRVIGRAQCFPGGLAASSLKRVSISHPFAVPAIKHSVFLP